MTLIAFLEWWGKDGPTIAADAEEGNPYAIARMKSAPKIQKPWLLEAYRDLETERQYVITMQGAIPLAIPIKRIHWYGKDWLRLDEDELDAFVWIMRGTDSFIVSKAQEKAARKSN